MEVVGVMLCCVTLVVFDDAGSGDKIVIVWRGKGEGRGEIR